MHQSCSLSLCSKLREGQISALSSCAELNCGSIWRPPKGCPLRYKKFGISSNLATRGPLHCIMGPIFNPIKYWEPQQLSKNFFYHILPLVIPFKVHHERKVRNASFMKNIEKYAAHFYPFIHIYVLLIKISDPEDSEWYKSFSIPIYVFGIFWVCSSAILILLR